MLTEREHMLVIIGYLSSMDINNIDRLHMLRKCCKEICYSEKEMQKLLTEITDNLRFVIKMLEDKGR